MKHKSTTYNRQALYEEVWKEPMITVAKRYGVSDVALKKTCERLKVPVPGRGHWAKIKSGQNIKQTPLPKYKGPEEIVVTRNIDCEMEKIEKQSSILNNIDEVIQNNLKEVCADIIVEEQLSKPHSLIIEAGSALKKYKPAFYNPPILRLSREVLDIAVTRTSLDRALRIMDALIKTVELLNVKVEVDKKNGGTFFIYKMEKVKVRLKEHIKQTPHVLTPEEIRMKQQKKYFYERNYDYNPTGELSLFIDEYWDGQKIWNDGLKRKVEDCLGEFVIRLFKAFNYEIRRGIEREQEQLKWLEEERKRIELKERRDREVEKLKNLENDANDWHRSQVIMNYIRALEDKLKREEIPENRRSKLLEYIEWAKAKVEWLDPLTNKEDIVLGYRKNMP